jgi:hypothetical protein
MLDLACLGYRAVVADLLWVRAVLLFGDRLGEEDPRWSGWLYHMVDLATDLDPEFRAAYKYGGIMLRVGGATGDQSSLIFAKGARHLPQEWYFPSSLGMNYYLQKAETRAYRAIAARHMRVASVLPGAPFYLRNLAASLTVEAESPRDALAFVEGELSGSPPGKARDALVVKRIELQWDVARYDAEEALKACASGWDRKPASPEEAVSWGCTLPRDPFGGQWRWDADAPRAWALTSSAYVDTMVALSRRYGLGRWALRDRGTAPQ